MTHAVYFAVPSGRSRLIDEIASVLWDDSIIDRIGCVVETQSDRRFLDVESAVHYESVDIAPDLSPSSVGDEPTRRSSSTSIDRLQAEYGTPFLTPFVVSDARYDHTTREAWRELVERTFGYFERTLNEFDPTVVVTPEISRPFEWVPVRIASRNGTYLWWKTTRVGSRYGLIEGTPYEEFCDIDDWYSDDRSEQTEPRQLARNYLSDVRESGSRPNFYARRSDSYGDSLLKLVFPHGLPTPREFGTLFQRWRSEATNFDDRRLPRAKNVWRRIRTRIEDPFKSPQSDETFVFFPLHAQPEPSTRLIAPLFEDQITLARQVARSLPVDCYLYVKDHPRMFRDNTRSPSYFRRLAEIPGVRVLSSNIDSHTLIRGSDAVVSVVGTPAMEAAFFDTPSVVFGPAHFTALSSVHRCRSLDNLPELLSSVLSSSGCEESELVAYLSTVFTQSFDVPTAASGSTPDAQRRMASRVAPVIRDRLQRIS